MVKFYTGRQKFEFEIISRYFFSKSALFFRTMVAKVGEERALAGQLAQKRAKGGKAERDEKNSAKGADKLKSGNFFAKLQQKVKSVSHVPILNL